MTNPIPDGAGGQPAGSFSLRTLLAVLVAPREAFRALAGRPRFAVALLVLVVSGVLAVHVSMSKVTADDFLRTVEESGRPVPPAARERPEPLLAVARWTQVGTAAIGTPLVYAALAGIFLAVFRLVGSELGYRQSLAVTAHGMLPFAVAALLGALVAATRETILLEELKWGGVLASNLGILAGEETGAVARALLTSVDAFSAWCVALLAIGFAEVARVSRSAAWTTVLAIWGAGIGLKLVLATIF